MAIGNYYVTPLEIISLEGFVALGLVPENLYQEFTPGRVFGINIEYAGRQYNVVFRGDGLAATFGGLTGLVNQIEIYDITGHSGSPTTAPLVSFLLLPFATPAQSMLNAFLSVAEPIPRALPEAGSESDVNFVTHADLFDLILPPGSGFGMIYTGSEGGDLVNGYVTDDNLSGAGGDDTILMSPGTDVLNGGAGTDTADARLLVEALMLDGAAGQISFASGVTQINDIEIVIGGQGNDTLDSGGILGTLYGGPGDDVITGRGPGELLVGNGGHDQITGGSGFDTIEGDDGNDVITGGNGFDSLLGGLGDDSLTGNNGADTFDGGAGHDTLAGGLGPDYMSGGDGNDLINGQAGGDFLFGNAGNDTLNGNAGADDLFGLSGNNLMNGGINNDVLQGGDGNDTLNAGNGSDTLYGGDGDDRLEGNAGSDTLGGQGGDDVLRGGIGADTFQFFAGDGHDRIVDFQNNIDALELDADLMTQAAPTPDNLRALASVNADGFLVLSFAGGESLTFTGIERLNPILDDVVFV